MKIYYVLNCRFETIVAQYCSVLSANDYARFSFMKKTVRIIVCGDRR
jgi:hypothetical protein